MSKHNQTLTLRITPETLLRLCQEVVQEFGWRVQEVSGTGLTAKEVASPITSFTWPARIDLTIEAKGVAEAELRIFGSIGGVGPLQSNHLKGLVGRFLNSLSVRVDAESEADRGVRVEPSSLASELRELGTLHSEGLLNAAEFEAAKARLLGGSEGS